MKHLVLLTSLFFAHASSAQEMLRIYNDSAFGNPMLTLSSMNYYGSNNLDNAFMDKFLFGGYIDQGLKDRNLDRIKSQAFLGGEAEQRIDSYTPTIHPLGKENYGLMLSFSDNHLFSANIPKDLYRLGMYGNAGSVGDTLNLSFAHGLYQHYQKLSFGFYNTDNMNSIQLSFITGSRGFEFQTRESYLWTHQDEDTVFLKLYADGYHTQSFSPYWAFQGTGFSVDVNYNFMFETKKGERQIVNFKVNNVGAIFWKKGTRQYYSNSSLNYTGFDIQDFLSDSASTDWNLADTFNLIQDSTRQIQALPMEFCLDKLPDLHGKKLQAIYGFKGMLTPNYRAYFYGGVYYQPKPYFSAATYLSWGGFSGFRWGLFLNYRLRDAVSVSVGTVDMIGNLSKNYGFGRSACLSASFKL